MLRSIKPRSLAVSRAVFLSRACAISTAVFSASSASFCATAVRSLDCSRRAARGDTVVGASSSSEEMLYIADAANAAVRTVTVDTTSGIARAVGTLAAVSGGLTAAMPTGLALGGAGDLYVSTRQGNQLVVFRGAHGNGATSGLQSVQRPVAVAAGAVVERICDVPRGYRA